MPKLATLRSSIWGLPEPKEDAYDDGRGTLEDLVIRWSSSGLRKRGLANVVAGLGSAEGAPLVLLEHGSSVGGSYEAALLVDRGEGRGGLIVDSSLDVVREQGQTQGRIRRCEFWKGPPHKRVSSAYDPTLSFDVDEAEMIPIRRLVVSGDVGGYSNNEWMSSGAAFLTFWMAWAGNDHMTVAGYGLEWPLGYVGNGSLNIPPAARPLEELVSRIAILVAREREKRGLLSSLLLDQRSLCSASGITRRSLPAQRPVQTRTAAEALTEGGSRQPQSVQRRTPTSEEGNEDED